MAAYEPRSKIQKLEEINAENDVFELFHIRYKDKMDTLRSAYDKLGGKSSAFKAIEIVQSDCTKSSSFTQAYLDVKEYTEKLYVIGPIFESGLNHLYNFLHRKEIPKDKNIKEILGSLLNYLLDKDIMDSLEDQTMGTYCKNESDVTLFVLNHMIMPLTPPTKCFVDDHIRWRFVCPDKCKNKALENVERADTSIGNPVVWHGRVDAMVGRSKTDCAISVKIIPDDCEDCEDTPSKQIMSQAIVFSFLQQKLHPKLQLSLIPTIGISAKELIVYFYDCKNDILLQSVGGFYFKTTDPVELMHTILVAWLVVNYKYLCDGFVETLKQASKANFFHISGDKIEMYKHKVLCGGVGMGGSNSGDWYFKYAESTFDIPSSYHRIRCIPND